MLLLLLSCRQVVRECSEEGQLSSRLLNQESDEDVGPSDVQAVRHHQPGLGIGRDDAVQGVTQQTDLHRLQRPRNVKVADV